MFRPLLDLIYPIGSFYITYTEDNPTEMFGGQWSMLPEGYGLRSANGASTVDSEGEHYTSGRNFASIALNQMPQHAHDLSNHIHSVNAVSIAASGGHNHWVYAYYTASKLRAGTDHALYTQNGDSHGSEGFGRAVQVATAHGTTYDSAHTHSVPAHNTNAPSSNISGKAGSGATIDFRDAAYQVNIWKRIA